jgi:hypothetical protein
VSSKLLGAGAILLVAVSLARTQPAEPLPPAPAPHEAKPLTLKLPLERLLPFVNDPAFQNELKLAPDQVKKLLALRQQRWDDEYNTARAELLAKQAERDATLSDALKAVLGADQFRRAEHLVVRLLWAPGFLLDNPFAEPFGVNDLAHLGPIVLKQHPDLGRALGLTEDQTRFADLPSQAQVRSVILLTAEQCDAARKMFGTPRPREWKAEHDPRTAEANRVAYSDTYAPLQIATIYRAELKITAEQAAAIGRPEARFGGRFRDLAPAEALKRAKEADVASEKELAKVLAPEQMKRLRQIAVRLRYDPTQRDVPEPLVAGLADALKVTAQQRQTFDALVKARAAALNRAVALDDFDAAYKGVRASDAELDKALLDALTAEQRAELKELVGDPLPVKRTRGWSLPLTDDARKQREESFGRYADELSLLNTNKAVQTELNLTADQLDLTRKSAQTFTGRFGAGFGPKKTIDPAEKSKFVGDALAGILDPRQAKRFRQLMIQHRERPDSPYTTAVVSGVTYPGVAEELKLTAEQKKRLIEGDHPVDVLTEGQRKAYKEMLGERFGGDFRPPRFTAGPGRTDRFQKERDRIEFLKVAPWEPLNLKPDQHTKLAVALNTYQLSGAEAAGKKGNPWAKIDPEKSGAGVLTFQRELDRALGAAAVTRVDQLALQSRAAHNPRDALTGPDTAKALALTPLQLARIADLEDDAVELAALVSASATPTSARDDALRLLRDKLDARTFALFTPEQSAKWKELTGEPSAFAKTVIRGPIIRPRSSDTSSNPWSKQ